MLSESSTNNFICIYSNQCHTFVSLFQLPPVVSNYTLPDLHVSTRYPSMQVKSFDSISFLLSQNHLALFSSSIKTAPANSCSNKYWRNSSLSIPIFIVAFLLDLQWIFKYFICFQFSPSPCFLLIICTILRLTFQTCKPFCLPVLIYYIMIVSKCLSLYVV